MNKAFEDLMIGSPSEPSEQQLKDLHLKTVMPVKAMDEKKRA
jgi:aspartyl-tRNA synthetase